MRSQLQVLQAYRDGDRLTDEELTALANDMMALAAAASPYGDMFRLQAVYARGVADACIGYLKARRDGRERRAHTP